MRQRYCPITCALSSAAGRVLPTEITSNLHRDPKLPIFNPATHAPEGGGIDRKASGSRVGQCLRRITPNRHRSKPTAPFVRCRAPNAAYAAQPTQCRARGQGARLASLRKIIRCGCKGTGYHQPSLFAALHASGCVQVFGRRNCETIPALLQPAIEKRQGTKSRWVGQRLCSGLYGDLATASDWARLHGRSRPTVVAWKHGLERRAERAERALRNPLWRPTGEQIWSPAKAGALPAESRPEWRWSMRWIGGEDIMRYRS
jgi:hypothetical protein